MLKFFGVVAFGASMIVAPVSVHSPVIEGDCDVVTYSHPQFNESFDPQLTLEARDSSGVVTDVLVESQAYSWGETVSFDVPGEGRYRVTLMAHNPVLGGFLQQVGQVDVWTVCPVDEPEVPVDEEPVIVVTETPSLPDVPVIEIPSAPVAPVAVETGRP